MTNFYCIPPRRRTGRWDVVFWIASIALLIGSLGAQAVTPTVQAPARAQNGASQAVYLPVLSSSDDFSKLPAVWSEPDPPGSPAVVLFRYTFDLAETWQPAALEIFADTRYSAWLDGVWLGRGPARFMRNWHEYDALEIGELAAGTHTLAVLVQWAPNTRRSESTRPYLMARLTGWLDGNRQELEPGAAWRAWNPGAWQTESPAVHAWGLIGPTEYLDLSALPADWMQPGFDDAGWTPVVLVRPDEIVPAVTALAQRLVETDLAVEAAGTGYQFENQLAPVERDFVYTYEVRNLPELEDTPLTYTLLDAGYLSPGWQMVEWLPGSGQPTSQPFTLTEPVTLTLETLGVEGAPGADLILLNEQELAWKIVSAARPDVYQTRVSLTAGQHTLNAVQLPPDGLTLAVRTEPETALGFPFSQGLNAGRRLLLAAPLTETDVLTATGSSGMTLTLTAPQTYVVLDLGRVVPGRLSALVSGSAGAILDIGWDERLYIDSLRPLPYPGSLHPEWNQVDSWVLDGSPRQIETIDARAGRYVVIAFWGPGEVQIENLQVHAEHYPVAHTGAFDSGDSDLNQIWQTGVDGALANMSDNYTDTPWRERGQWWGDAYVIDQINQVAFGDQQLLRRGLQMIALQAEAGYLPGLAPHGDGVVMLDYGMLWVQALAEQVRKTGDTRLVYAGWGDLVAFMERLETYTNPQSGLLDIPFGHWSQTVYLDTVAYWDRYGQSTAVNALYVQTLKEAAWLAIQTGQAAQALEWSAQTEAVQTAANTWLFSPVEGRYLATIYQGEPKPASLYAQAWALAYGLPEPEDTAGVAAALLDLLPANPGEGRPGTYGMYWVLRGLGEAGEIQAGLEVIRSYYGYMVARGATTWWETLRADQSYNSSLSHGWGGSPTWFMSTYLSGFEPVSPDEIRLAPVVGVLESYRISLPYQNERIGLDWQATGCGTGLLSVAMPENVQGSLELPDGWYAPVVENTPGSAQRIDLAPGWHAWLLQAEKLEGCE